MVALVAMMAVAPDKDRAVVTSSRNFFRTMGESSAARCFAQADPTRRSIRTRHCQCNLQQHGLFQSSDQFDHGRETHDPQVDHFCCPSARSANSICGDCRLCRRSEDLLHLLHGGQRGLLRALPVHQGEIIDQYGDVPD